MQHNHLSIFNVVVCWDISCFRPVQYSCHCGLFLDESELTLVSTSGTKPATRHVTLRPKPSSGNMSGRKVSWNEGCEEGDAAATTTKRPCEQRNGQFQHVLENLKDLDRLIHHARARIHVCSKKMHTPRSG